MAAKKGSMRTPAPKPPKPRGAQDSTRRNVVASNTRDEALARRIQVLENRADLAKTRVDNLYAIANRIDLRVGALEQVPQMPSLGAKLE